MGRRPPPELVRHDRGARLTGTPGPRPGGPAPHPAAVAVTARGEGIVGRQHLDATELPRWLAHLHRRLPVGAAVALEVAGALPVPLADLLAGAGFAADDRGVLRRQRTLPDTVAAGMRLLVAGLNPSLYAADAGIGFARPGNRFWPAVLAAGLATVDRDPDHALAQHGLGMTDLVKRATRRADELAGEEFAAGVARVARLVGWLRPGAVCLVGLAGWRAAVDRRARAGWQPPGPLPAPTYLLPSTSGLNARTPLAELVDHLRRAAAGPAGAGVSGAGG